MGMFREVTFSEIIIICMNVFSSCRVQSILSIEYLYICSVYKEINHNYAAKANRQRHF